MASNMLFKLYNASDQILYPLEVLLSPVLPTSTLFTESQIAFAPKFFLLSVIALLLISCSRATLWYCKAKARLDNANPDEILADRELRALRRALLMVDVVRFVPRLIKNITHRQARKRIEGQKERGDGMVSIHSRTTTLEPFVGVVPSVIGSDAVMAAARISKLSLKYPSQVNRAQNVADNEKQAAAASISFNNNISNSQQPQNDKHTEMLNLLRTHTLFKYIDPALLSILATSVQEITLKSNQILFRCGTTVATPSLYIVKQGSVRTYVEDVGGDDIGKTSASKKYLRTLNAGDTLSALLDLLNTLTGLPIECQVTAMASLEYEETIVYKWDQDLLQRLGQEHPIAIGRLVRMILVKLNRASTSVAYQYLGLTSELTVSKPKELGIARMRKQFGSDHLQANRNTFTNGCRAAVAAVFGVDTDLLPDVCIPSNLSFKDDPKEPITLRKRTNSGNKKFYSTERLRMNSGSQGSQDSSGSSNGSAMFRSPSLPADLYQASINAGRTSSSLSSSLSTSLSSVSLSSMNKSKKNTKEEKEKLEEEEDKDKNDDDDDDDDDEEDSMLLHVLEFNNGDILASPGDPPCMYFVVQGELDVIMKNNSINISEITTNGSSHSNSNATNNAQSSSRRYRKSSKGKASFKKRSARSSTGSLRQQNMEEDTQLRSLFHVGIGSLVGLLPLQTGEPWLMTVKSLADHTLVVRVTRECYATLVQLEPKCLLRATALLCKSLSPLLRMIDYGLTWRRMEPGEILVHQGDACDRLFVVLHGRLREMPSRKRKGSIGGNGNRFGSGSNGSKNDNGLFTVDITTPPCAVAGGRHMIVGEIENETKKTANNNNDDDNKNKNSTNNRNGRSSHSSRNSIHSASPVSHRYKNMNGEEYGRGSCVGESEVLVGATFKTTICAIRETEVVEMSRELFHIVASTNPSVHQHVTFNLTKKLLEKNGQHSGSSIGISGRGLNNSSRRKGGSRDNISTIAVLPITNHAPIQYLVRALSESLNQSTSVATVSSDRIRIDLGLENSSLFAKTKTSHSTDDDPSNKTTTSKEDNEKQSHEMFTVMSYLSQLEEMHRIVVYACDSVADGPSKWTETCLRQADVVLLVGHNADPPDVTDFEKWATKHMSYAQNVLVLIHDMDWVENTLERERKRCATEKEYSKTINEGHLLYNEYRPRNTRSWIHARSKTNGNVGVQQHLHIRIYKEDYRNGTNFDGNSPFSDVARLGRWLMGTQTGLTLGGGGARGLAHVGVYEAMVESGIPIDVVGGTSQGAFIGALIGTKIQEVLFFVFFFLETKTRYFILTCFIYCFINVINDCVLILYTLSLSLSLSLIIIKL